MEKSVSRQCVSFRLNAKLLAALRKRAEACHCGLNDYVESVLLDAIYYEPNATTVAAMEEARTGKDLE